MTRLTITTLIIFFTLNVNSQTQMQRYLPSFSGTNSALSAPEGFSFSFNPVLISIKSFNDGKGNTIGDASTINVPVTILGLIYVPKFKLFGALQAGLSGDIILVKGKPWENISDTRNVQNVF